MLPTSDLIVAAATPAGPGARAIVRLAGEGLDVVLGRLFTAEPPGFPASGDQPRVVAARLAGNLESDWRAIPVAILHWPGPGGPVGGPLAEVQLPGSGPLVAALITEACRLGGRLARGGEFTLRGFLAGRLDLVQAEAVLAVVDASSPAELVAALDRMAAGSGGALAAARDQLLDLVADIEAGIDFADETAPDGVPAGPDWTAMAGRIAACERTITAVGARLAERDLGPAILPRVVLVGPPNIGKSSLFNALVGREAALVADERGTTRDWLESPLGDDAGPRCTVVDLPGFEPDEPGSGMTPADEIAAEARRRGQDERRRADVVLVCQDAGAAAGPLAAVGVQAGTIRIDVATRCDLGPSERGLATSSLTGRGIPELRAAILAAVASLPPRSSPATTRLAVACGVARRAVAEAVRCVDRAVAGEFVDESLVAADLRRAAESLADVTGASVDIDMLDRIFSRHCIGK